MTRTEAVNCIDILLLDIDHRTDQAIRLSAREVIALRILMGKEEPTPESDPRQLVLPFEGPNDSNRGV